MAWTLRSRSNEVRGRQGLSPASARRQRPRTQTPGQAPPQGDRWWGALAPRSPGRARRTCGTSSAPRGDPKASARAALPPATGHRLRRTRRPSRLRAPTRRTPRPEGTACTYRSGSARGCSAGWAARPSPAAPGRLRGPGQAPGRSWSSGCRRPRLWAPRPPPRPPRGSPRSAGTWWPQRQPQPPGPGGSAKVSGEWAGPGGAGRGRAGGGRTDLSRQGPGSGRGRCGPCGRRGPGGAAGSAAGARAPGKAVGQRAEAVPTFAEVRRPP